MSFPLIEYHLTRADISRAVSILARRSGHGSRERRWRLAGAVAGGFGGLAGALLTDVHPVLYGVVASLFLLGAGLGYLIVFGAQLFIRRSTTDLALATGTVARGLQRVWLDGDGLHYDRPGFSLLSRWGAFEVVEETDQSIMTAPVTAPAVPAALSLLHVVPASVAPATRAAFAAALNGGPGSLARARDVATNPSPRLVGTLAAEDYLAFNRHYTTTTTGRAQRLLLLATAALLGAFAGNVILSPMLGVLAGTGAGAVLAVVALLALLATQRAQVDRLVDIGAYRTGGAAWWFDDEHVHEEIAGRRQSIAWELIRKVEAPGRVGIIWFGDAVALLVPRSAPGADAFLAAVADRVAHRPA